MTPLQKEMQAAAARSYRGWPRFLAQRRFNSLVRQIAREGQGVYKANLLLMKHGVGSKEQIEAAHQRWLKKIAISGETKQPVQSQQPAPADVKAAIRAMEEHKPPEKK